MTEQFTTTRKRRKADNGKPEKPKCPRCGNAFGRAHKDCYPLFPHATGRWAKKIIGRLHYFGRWANTQAGEIIPVDDVDASASEAEELYNAQKIDLHNGRKPKVESLNADDGYTIRNLCNEFLTSKLHKVDSGELSRHTFSDYQRSCDLLIEAFGKWRRVDDLAPDDFEKLRAKLNKELSIVTVKNEINRCRIILKYAHDQQKIEKPVAFGQSFDKPSARALRKLRNEAGPKLFAANELTPILAEADPWMRAMVLLGINGGLGNTDCANLPKSAIDFESGWLMYPRPKTEVQRRIPLWQETLEALEQAIDTRPKPKNLEDDKLCFVTIQGNRWVRITPSKTTKDRYVTVNSVSKRFSALLKELSISGKQGWGFYTLRHTFETVAGESKDQVAVDALMGHVDGSMAAVYRERISDERLRAVADHVHDWLFCGDTTGDSDEAERIEATEKPQLRVIG
ncbi:MAG: hypothetical protein CMJ64_11110 [Planctomycetaceae bacterium]|nr:hypothetical protein [Planctomycetaceae bacterium]